MDALPGIEEFILFLVTETLVLGEIIRVLRREMIGKVLIAKRRIPIFGVAGLITLTTIVFRGARTPEPLVEQADDACHNAIVLRLCDLESKFKQMFLLKRCYARQCTTCLPLLHGLRHVNLPVNASKRPKASTCRKLHQAAQARPGGLQATPGGPSSSLLHDLFLSERESIF
jgi:hypothetical protein